MVCEASKYMTFSKVEDNFHMETKEPDYVVEYIPEFTKSEIKKNNVGKFIVKDQLKIVFCKEFKDM